jgi:hypothetical protein
MDDLGFVVAIDRLGESVVVAVTDAADGGFDARLGPALCVGDAALRAADALLFVKRRYVWC